MADCKVNEIFRGEVSSVQNYGAFIKIPGCPQQGLVHKTQVSASHVDDVADVLQKGDKIWCKTISINDEGKIALSMKYVNQGNGKDLDPNGVQMHLDDQKRKTMSNRQEKKAIVLDAVYKTTCSKCKTPGHLARDCFSTPDGKKYELIPEIDDIEISPPPQPQSVVQDESKSKEKEKKHKSKKSKKRKKNKSSHKDSSDEDENDCSDEKKKKKKKKSKESKHKKKKRHHSSSDSDSSECDSNSDKQHSKKCKRSKEKHGDGV
ncbi:nucleolar protein of 40 kDa [Copidosoma floridanum]|uniref:nucleolar protein of 40 kDa n=1 Tax=Copidosoma floridanum TaxID=29053 RepID=UPI0006C99FF0|nr:nucleolar protein of 40 kDa [Copidosoma floridanum]